LRAATELMLDEINRHSGILPGYELKVVFQDGKCESDKAQELLLWNLFRNEYEAFAPGVPLEALNTDGVDAISGQDVRDLLEVWTGDDALCPMRADQDTDPRTISAPVGILGGGCSAESEGMVGTARMAYLPIVSGSSTFPGLSDGVQYPNFWRTSHPDKLVPTAWLEIARMFNFSSVTTVLGDTETWKSFGQVLIDAADQTGVRLDGVGMEEKDLPNGLLGYQFSQDSQREAKQTVGGIAHQNNRIVLLFLYEKRARMLLCEAYKLGLDNFIWMVFSWYSGKWYMESYDVTCSGSEMLSIARGFVAVGPATQRTDTDIPLSCSEGMTTPSFVEEWLRRQGDLVSVDVGLADLGFYPVTHAFTMADAVCMYALALDAVLIGQGVSLTHLRERRPPEYHQIQEAFASSDFEGVSGRVRFPQGSKHPDGSLLVQHLQSSTDVVLRMAEYSSDGVFTFLGLGHFEFKLHGERIFAGPAGATGISAVLAPFQDCQGLTLNYGNNSCEPCPDGLVHVSSIGSCECRAGYMTFDTGCSLCDPGRFSSTVGSTECEECPLGRFAHAAGQTSCASCAAGKFADQVGSTGCPSCGDGATTMASGAFESSNCYFCGPGEYAVDSGEGISCVMCGAGTFTSSYGSTECNVCPVGMTTAEGDAECQFSASYIISSFVVGALLAIAAVLLSLSVRRSVLIDDISLQGRAVVVTSSGPHLLEQWPLRFVGGSMPVTIADVPDRGLRQGQFRVRIIDKTALAVLTADGKPICQRVDASMGRLEVPVLMGILCTGRSKVTVALIVPLLLASAAALIVGTPLAARESCLAAALSSACGAAALLWRECSRARRRHHTSKGAALIKFKKRLAQTFDKYSQQPSPYSCNATSLTAAPDVVDGGRSSTQGSEPRAVTMSGQRALSIGQVLDLMESFGPLIRDRNMYYVVPELVKPLTELDRLSYAEVAGCGKVDWFVSHYWGDPFGEFVQSLQGHAQSCAQRMDCSGDAEAWRRIRYWICSLCINQWTVHLELGDKRIEDTPFFVALWNASCVGTVMVIQETAEPLKRSWCLFEVLQTFNRLDNCLDNSDTAEFQGLYFATRSGVLNAGTAPVDTVLQIGAHIGDIYFEHAHASEQKDKDMINQEVQNRGGFAVLNQFVRAAVWDIVLESKEKLETSILDIGSKLQVSSVDMGEKPRRSRRSEFVADLSNESNEVVQIDVVSNGELELVASAL